MAKGYLVVSVYNGSIASPIENATVNINNLEFNTDEFGKTKKIELNTVYMNKMRYYLIDNMI